MELAHIVDDVRLGLVNDLRNVGGRRLLPLEDAQDVDLGRFDERSQLPEVRNDQKRCWLTSVASGHAPLLTQLDSFVQELAYEWTADLPMAKDSRYRALLRRSWTFARCMLQLSPSAARVSPSRVAISRARSSSGISEDASATSLGTRSRYRRSISSRRRASARSATEPCPGMIQLTRSMTSCRRLSVSRYCPNRSTFSVMDGVSTSDNVSATNATSCSGSTSATCPSSCPETSTSSHGTPAISPGPRFIGRRSKKRDRSHCGPRPYVSARWRSNLSSDVPMRSWFALTS